MAQRMEFVSEFVVSSVAEYVIGGLGPFERRREGTRMKIILAQPRGFCAGVVRAIDVVERALAQHGAPVYVRHEIVHNRHVVESLKAKGARFVETLKDVPRGALTIFSAHGVWRKVEDEAKLRSLPTIDATCPLVTKVHNQGRRYIAQGRVLVFIGHEGHPEVEGTLGQIDGEAHLVEDEQDVAELSPARGVRQLSRPDPFINLAL
jgi:4-hydroxy-3-methylbut-2-enyl diphosphate reductase